MFCSALTAGVQCAILCLFKKKFPLLTRRHCQRGLPFRPMGPHAVGKSGALRRFYFYSGRCVCINELMINEEIRDREVRVVDENGEQMGILPIRQALELAEQKQLDLVKIAPQAKPPVCKLMDYGKYRFEQSKKEREMRKNQKVVNIKEVRLSATIEEHDIDVKTRAAQKFLKDGDKVKVSIRFRGRQITHSEIGTEIMHDFAERIKDFGIMERKPIIEGRNMIMVLAPREG